MRACTSCSVEKDESAFAKKGNGRRSKCRACQSQYHKQWYGKNRRRRLAQVAKAHARWRNKRQSIIDELKSRPCVDCNRTFPACAMDFDHVRGTKKFSISGSAHVGISIDRLFVEIAKCEIVCACCHRVRTHKRRRSSTSRAVAR